MSQSHTFSCRPCDVHPVRSHLQDSAADERAAGVAPDAEASMVVRLTVRNPVPVRETKTRKHTNTVASHSGSCCCCSTQKTDLEPLLLADVLSGQSAAALTALEAGDVPLPLQRQQGLTLLDFLAAAGAVCNTTQHRRGERRVKAALLFPPSGRADGASRSGLQDDLRRRWQWRRRRLTVCTCAGGCRERGRSKQREDTRRLVIGEGNYFPSCQAQFDST